ncbi:hypothetical protein H4R34_000308 [Dimargaris verticillata]|uniref:Peptidase S1 domain-containing protein n=1 Tax=Dimargaris verticillata TaxID=2761393 RepID=A0A9W8B6F9_9FUNG|nr:hypothetical protein H4R34_000308 [Dimargaris verticillata]
MPRSSLCLALLGLAGCWSGLVAAATTQTASGFERIIGGSDAKQNQFPFMAHLRVFIGPTRFSECGASILSEEWILTAAHCVTQQSTGLVYNPSAISVTIGTVSSILTDGPVAREVVVHPDFDPSVIINDIALIRLRTPLPLSDSVQPTKIWTTRLEDSQEAFAIGWGTTIANDTSQQPDTLQVVNLNISNDRSKCYQVGARFTNSNGPVVCTANNPGRDTCQGDSGGPLVVTNDDGGASTYAQVGLTSYGYSPSNTAECGASDGLAFYTHIAYYLDFVTATTRLRASDITAGDNSTMISDSGSGGGQTTFASGSSRQGFLTPSSLLLTTAVVAGAMALVGCPAFL